MSWLSAFNFLELNNVKHANRAQMQLDDYKDEAQAMQQQGAPVKSWHEFNQAVEQQTPNYIRNIAVGVGAGAAVLGGVAMVIGTAGTALLPIALSGGAIGGMIGGYHDTENSQRNSKVEAYGQYLKQAKAAVSSGITSEQLASLMMAKPKQMDAPSPNVAPEIIAANASPKVQMDKGCGCGH